MWVAIGLTGLYLVSTLGVSATQHSRYNETPLCQIEMNGSTMKKNCSAKVFGHHDKSSSKSSSRS
jgi:hypothetical protein